MMNSTEHQDRDAQIPDARSPGRVNFVRWHITFVGSVGGTSCISASGACNFEVASRFSKNLYTPAQ
jgi:hypothetical protein